MEQHWCLPPTLRYSDLIGLGDNLGIDNVYNSLDDSNVQSSVQTTHLGYLFFFWPLTCKSILMYLFILVNNVPKGPNFIFFPK